MLIVEDDPTACRLLRSLFTGRGLDVRTAHSVAEGIGLLATRPDYLILDKTLPDGDGRRVLEWVRRDGLPTRVVVTTGWGATADIEELRPDAVLRKPLDPERLLAALGLTS